MPVYWKALTYRCLAFILLPASFSAAAVVEDVQRCSRSPSVLIQRTRLHQSGGSADSVAKEETRHGHVVSEIPQEVQAESDWTVPQLVVGMDSPEHKATSGAESRGQALLQKVEREDASSDTGSEAVQPTDSDSVTRNVGDRIADISNLGDIVGEGLEDSNAEILKALSESDENQRSWMSNSFGQLSQRISALGSSMITPEPPNITAAPVQVVYVPVPAPPQPQPVRVAFPSPGSQPCGAVNVPPLAAPQISVAPGAAFVPVQQMQAPPLRAVKLAMPGSLATAPQQRATAWLPGQRRLPVLQSMRQALQTQAPRLLQPYTWR